MKVKNLVLGDICTVRRLTDYLDFWEECDPQIIDPDIIYPSYETRSIFYRHKNHVYDLKNFRRYKLVRPTTKLEEKLLGRKVVVNVERQEKISQKTNLTRKEALKVFQKIK